mmetsp:Transcript_26601/g.30550  ORF Transcript_26601/g.30550 Transcript_26601/m.30550 type:complete len:86 (+) Transcript_26601:2-259(+)
MINQWALKPAQNIQVLKQVYQSISTGGYIGASLLEYYQPKEIIDEIEKEDENGDKVIEKVSRMENLSNLERYNMVHYGVPLFRIA